MKSNWRKRPAGMRHDLSKWVRSGGSLTERIMERCGNFSVRHVSNRFSRADRDEAGKIGAARHESVLVREVYLCCGEIPVVFAHSVAARKSLKGPWRKLRFLGQRSLGSAFLSDPAVGRGQLEYLAVSRTHPLYGKSCRFMKSKPAKLWARRSLFFRGKNAILVTEVFLPEIAERS